MRPTFSTEYHLHRAVTGRLASGLSDDDEDKQTRVKKQQVQNIPKALRDAVVPRHEGYVMVGGDFKAVEWGIMMYYCTIYGKEPDYHEELLAGLWDGTLDPHRRLASVAFKRLKARCPKCAVVKEVRSADPLHPIKCEPCNRWMKDHQIVGPIPESEIEPSERTTCKPYTHGYCFDGSPTVLAQTVRHPPKVGVAVCHAHDIAYRTRYTKTALVEMATEQNYLETPAGWRMYFWEYPIKGQDAIARYIQATAGDLCKTVLKDVLNPPKPEWFPSTTTHDSFMIEVPEKDAEEGKEWLREKMEQPMPWMNGRRWRADVSSGRSWKDVA